VQIESLAVRLRPRSPLEAADLGVALCRGCARSVYPCFLVAALPVVIVSMASHDIARWLPLLVIWWAKPWLDRTVLFVLSRAAFGQQTLVSDLWRAQRDVWWRQLPLTWTFRRLSPWRSMTQPVYQLEGLSFWNVRPRVRQIRRRHSGQALVMTSAFSVAELSLLAAVISVVFWLAPQGESLSVTTILDGGLGGVLAMALPVAYAMAVLFLEPFYVAAGFAMYLNRRAELEAWDIEQEFRRAFAG